MLDERMLPGESVIVERHSDQNQSSQTALKHLSHYVPRDNIAVAEIQRGFSINGWDRHGCRDL